MIDQNRMNELLENGLIRHGDELSEILYLARMGLWAKHIGIPTINLMGCQMPSERFSDIANQALAALPKDEK